VIERDGGGGDQVDLAAVAAGERVRRRGPPVVGDLGAVDGDRLDARRR